MDPASLGILAALGGTLLGSLTTWGIARESNAAAEKRIKLQVALEARTRHQEERRRDMRTLLAEIIVALDPESDTGISYPTAVRLIVEVQLLLDVRSGAEKALNGELNEMLAILGGYFGDGGPDRAEWYMRHGRVIEAARGALGLTPLDTGAHRRTP